MLEDEQALPATVMYATNFYDPAQARVDDSGSSTYLYLNTDNRHGGRDGDQPSGVKMVLAGDFVFT